MHKIRILIALLLIVLGILLIFSSGCVQQEKNNDITFASPDGVQINASFYPKTNTTVILVHEYRGNRNQWDSFVPVLLENNYSVIAYDMRSFTEDNAESTLSDVAGAVLWLHNNTDSRKIFVIGASFGANIAFVSSSFKEINAAVVMSPLQTKGQMLGNSLDYFRPHNVLFMSDINERQNAETLYGFTIPPKDLKIYGGTAHGIEILQNKQAVADILSWLKDK